tara:strand:- start:527 stop:1363 length:837 start_codon:yes stop_codon:yes gene_type:complete
MLISVIIVTKNRAEFLRKAINSVINQTYKNIELIVIDDGSQLDNSPIIDQFNLKALNITYFKNITSKGANYCRNLGFKKSKGDYVAYLDDDDLWLENKIKKQLEEFRDEEVDIVTCDFKYKKFFSKYRSNIKNEFKLNYIFKNNYLGGMSGIILRKKSFNIDPFDINLQSCQDWDFWIKCFLNNKKIKVVKLPLYIYTIYSFDKITDNIKKSYNGRKTLFIKYKSYYGEFLKKQKIYELLTIKYIINKDLSNFLGILFKNKYMNFRLKVSFIKKYLLN